MHTVIHDEEADDPNEMTILELKQKIVELGSHAEARFRDPLI